MDTDVADGRGERAGEVEERLDIAPVVRAARDPLAEEQDAHELAVGGEGNGDHGLQYGHLAGDLPPRHFRRARLGLVDLDQASLGHEPEGQPAVGREADGVDQVWREASGGPHAVLAVLVFGEEDGAPARPGQLGDGIEEQIEHAGQIEAGGQGLGELARHLRQVARGGFGRRIRVLGQRAQGHGPPGRAEGRHLLQEEQLLVRLAKHPAQVRGGEGLEEGEIRALDGQLVIRGEPVGGQDAHDDRGGSKLARLGDEALEVTGRAGHLLQDQVHLGEPEGSEGVVVRPGGKDRAVAEDPQQASPERVVLRDEEDGSHAGTRVRSTRSVESSPSERSATRTVNSL